MHRCSGNQRCCSDPRQSCFGKRRDAFFCYNDDRAQMCPSPWQPTNSRFIVYRNCNHVDPNASEHVKSTRSETESQPDTSYPTSFPNRSDKKKNGELKQTINYLRNCVRQRYIIDWTDEDDEQLLECTYNKITALHANKTEEVLHRVIEQARRQKDDDLAMFVEKLLEKFSRPQASNRRGTEGRRTVNSNRCSSATRNYVNSNAVDNHKPQMGCKCKQCQKEAAKSGNLNMDDYNKGCPQCSRHGNSSSNQNGQPSCSQHGQSGCNEHEHSCDEYRTKSNGPCDPSPLRGGNDQIARRPNQWFNEDSLDDTDFIIAPRRISPPDCDSRSLYDSGTLRHRNHCLYANQPGSMDAFIGPNHLYNMHRMRM